MTASPPTLTLSGPRATIALGRPDQHNRLEPQDVVVLGGMVRELAERADLRLVVITGAGPTFCSGYHLGAMAEGGMGATSAGSPSALIAVIDQIEALPMPTLAAVNGSLYGGGVDLALACDFRIGVAPSKAFIPIARIGAQYPDTAIHRLVSRAGAAMARRLLMAGETVEAAAMLACGLLDQAVDPADWAARVEAYALQIEALAPLSTRAAKRVIADMGRLAYDADAARASALTLQLSADHQEGLAALRDKRAPRFEGR